MERGVLNADAFLAGMERGMRGPSWRAERFPRPADLYKVLEPKSRSVAYTEAIDDHLCAIRDRELNRLIVTIGPQLGKSERVSRTFPTWMLLNNPDQRITLCSYEKETATRFGRAVRTDVIVHDGRDESIDLGLRIRSDTWAADRWQLEGHRGGMYCVGVGGALTSRPSDLMIIDDPFKNREEANSALRRQRVWDWWTSTARTRLAPGAPVVVVLTRWHENDLAGRLLEEAGDRWTVLNIPALAEENDPLGRNPGTWLETTRGTTVDQWEETRKDVGELDFAALYQGHPTPAAGGLFKRKYFRYWDDTDDPWMIRIPGRPGPDENLRYATRFICVDLAASTRTSADFTVASAWAIAGTGELILLDVERGRVDPERHWDDLVGPLQRRWQAPIYVEASQHGTDLVYTAAREGAVIHALQADKDKFSRALPAARRMETGQILFPRARHWLGEWEQEVLAFPQSAHDDQVDTLAYAHRVRGAIWVAPDNSRGGHGQHWSPPEPNPLDHLSGGTDLYSAPL